MKAKANLEPRKVKEEELKPTTSPIPFSNKGMFFFCFFFFNLYKI